MRVNHYVVKSLEEFLLGKHLRGSAATARRVKHKAYFKAHDRNDETCLLAARWPLKSKPKWQQYRRSWMPYPQKRVHRKATPGWRPALKS